MSEPSEEQKSNRDYTETRRDVCQPISEAASVLTQLIELWDKWFPQQDLMTTMFEPMWNDDNTSGAYQIDQIREVEEAVEFVPGEIMTPEGRIGAVKIALVMTACAFAVQAMKEGAKTKPNYTSRAWSYVADANHWLGILQGYLSGNQMTKDLAASVLGKKGAAATHVENRAMKASVMLWCDSNMPEFKSMDAAAEALAGKVVPVTFRTAREWIAEWKKVRSSGTP